MINYYVYDIGLLSFLIQAQVHAWIFKITSMQMHMCVSILDATFN